MAPVPEGYSLVSANARVTVAGGRFGPAVGVEISGNSRDKSIYSGLALGV